MYKKNVKLDFTETPQGGSMKIGSKPKISDKPKPDKSPKKDEKKKGK